MAFSLPDYGEGVDNIQSLMFQEYLETLVDGINGKNCVLSGLAVTGGADMTPAVAKGSVLSNGVLYAIAAADVTISAADATNPRIDLIVVTSAGALAVRAGTAAPLSTIKPPARTANDVVIAAVYVPANDTAIASNQITDLRMIRENGPITIYKTTTAETTNTTAAAVHILNKAGSGLVIPDGLFLAGRILRVRIGGNMLLNSGTPTVRIAITYGGTTMFSDISGASTADADRLAFFHNFQITAQGNADQALSGILSAGIIAAKTAPTTGLGDAWSTAYNIGSISGAAAVDSDAANRTLTVEVKMSVSNAANEIVVETCTVEII